MFAAPVPLSSVRSSTAPRLRRATLADADAIADCQLKLAAETESVALDRDVVAAGVRRAIESDVGAVSLVVDAADSVKVIATMLLTREWSDWRNGYYLWFQSIYVVAVHRRRGIATAMMQTVIDEVRDDGEIAGLRLYVESENESAESVYHALGFVPSGHRILESLF